MTVHQRRDTAWQFWIAASLSLFAALAFFFSTNAKLRDLDYTSQIASALLRGHLGLTEKPPEWLNEMIPHGHRYYSAFPLGAVLSMIPIALLQKARLIHDFPGHVLAALIAGSCIYFFFQIAKAFGPNYSKFDSNSLTRRILLALFPIFGTWTWCNLGFAGAWQIALGLALLGETAALYFTLVRPSPILAGAFFALAFGNRTELLITLPLYLYFLWGRANGTAVNWFRINGIKQELWGNGPMAIRFLSLPVTLALLTAAYNFARFHSIFDFGYLHIPEVAQEPWYEHGLFSIHAIPWNIYTMLFQGFENISYFPYIQPNGFGCSIFLASPLLCLLFREGGRYRVTAWMAIALLTLVLWCHGNPGSWQFSYRYAMILLPWIFLLLTGNGPAKISVSEISLFVVSIAINAMATWQFLWTDQIQP
ncbi:MAG: hypothetical protein WAN04_04805 [Candidatus Udaeobacter sp.]